MTIYYTYDFEQPNPYIICSKDLLHTVNLGRIDWYDGGTDVTDDSDYPDQNTIDGNRDTYAQYTGIGSQGATGTGPLLLRADYLYAPKEDYLPHIFCMETDPHYPVNQMEIIRHDTGWGGSPTEVKASYPNTWVPSTYTHGIPPRVDGEAIGEPFDSDYRLCGLDGRYVTVFFDDVALDTDWFLYEFKIQQPGRNILGIDGSWDNGLWAAAVDEVLKGTSDDPCPSSTGANDNYIEISTSISGADKVSAKFRVGIRPSKEYMLGFYMKTVNTAIGGGAYNINIQYYDREDTPLGTELLWSTTSAFGWSGKLPCPVNYIGKTDGKRYSGLQNQRHLVPEETFTARIQFEVEADSSVTLTMKVDDVAFYDMSIPFRPEEYIKITDDGEDYIFPLVLDVSGTVRIKRLSLYEYITATSRWKNHPSTGIDMFKQAPSNPSTVDYSVQGKTIVEDFYGNIASQFVPRAGLKRKQNFTWVVNKRTADFLQSMAGKGDPIGIIDPYGDWSDWVVLNDLKISHLSTPSPKRRFSYKEIEQPNDFFQALVPVAEI